MQNALTIRRTRQALTSALLGVLLLAGSLFGYRVQMTQAAAGIPLVINYQARVTDPSGTPVAAATNMRFIIYDAVSAGNCVWSAFGTGTNGCSTDPDAGEVAVTPVAGVFSFSLGDTTIGGQNAIPADLFTDDSRYLEVKMYNGSTWETLSPRKRLTSSPYSMNANLLDGLNTSAAGGAAAFVPVTDASGNFTLTKNVTFDTNTFFVDSTNHRVGIGDATPDALFTVGNGDLFQVDSSGNITTKGSTMTVTNDLAVTLSGGVNGINFDSNTLSIDATNHRVGIGTATPTVLLQVTKTAAASSREQIMKFGTTDAGNDAGYIGNATATDGFFIPMYSGYQASVADVVPFQLRALTSAANDASDSSSLGMLDLVALRTDSATDPNNGTLSAIVNRKILTVRNGPAASDTKFTIMASGNVGIGDTTPAALFTVGNTDLFQVDSSGNITTKGSAMTVTNDLAVTLSGGVNGINFDSNTLSIDATNHRVGIGTASPAAALGILTSGTAFDVETVLGQTFVGWKNSADHNYYAAQNLASTTGDFQIFVNSNGGSGWIEAVHAQRSNGYVGIGDATPAALFTVGNGDLFQVNSSGAITASTGITTSGNTILGDALGDSVTINAGAMTVANDLVVTLSGGVNGINFDFDTFTIDAADHRVGIRTAAPVNDLQIGATPATPTSDMGLAVFRADRGAIFQTDLATSSSNGRAFAITNNSASYWTTVFYSNGAIGIGPGDATRDAFLSRSAGNTLMVSGSFDTATPGHLSVTGNATVNGNATLGDASGDSITINAGTMTVTNDLAVTVSGGVNGINFDSNTLSIDATNHRVGIGTSAPASLLDVTVSDAVTNGYSNAMVINHATSGTAAAGFGTSQTFALENAAGTLVEAGGVRTSWKTATGGAEDGKVELFTTVNGVAGKAVWTAYDGSTGGEYAYAYLSSSDGGLQVGFKSGDAGGGGAFVGSVTDHDIGFGAGGSKNISVIGTTKRIVLVNGVPGSIASAAGAVLDSLSVASQTVTVTGTTQIATATGFNYFAVNAPTITDSSAVTIDHSATQYISGAPTAAGSVTITNSYALWVDSGAVRLDGNLGFNTSASKIDFASTDGNTFIWEVPQNSGSTACSSGAAEGIIIKDGGGSQRGHICVSGPSAASPDKLHFFAEAFNSTATDVAENYSTDPEDGVNPGDVVALGTDGGLLVKKAVAGGSVAIGAISTRPGIKLTGIDEATGESETFNSMPVALSGRVPVSVTSANGAIAVGDPIGASAEPGVGAKAIGPGQIIGYALEPYDSAEIGKILVFIQPGYNDGAAIDIPAADNAASELTVNLAATLSSDLDLAGFSIRNVVQLAGVNGQWMIDENGVLTQVLKNDNGDRTLYAASSQNATVTLFGNGQLEAGQTRVAFTQEQKDVMAPTVSYNVIVTLTGSASGVYVPAKDYEGFQVAEIDGGRSGATFDWTVIARRRGYESANDLGVVPGQITAQEPTTNNQIPNTPIVEEPPVETPPIVEAPPVAVEPAPVEVPPAEPVIDAPPVEEVPVETPPVEIVTTS